MRMILAPLALLAAPALAQTPAHSVRFAEAAPQGRLVVRDVLWSCAGESCTGGRSSSRPAIVCQSVARNVGPVAAFNAGGRDFEAAELERCNASARR